MHKRFLTILMLCLLSLVQQARAELSPPVLLAPGSQRIDMTGRTAVLVDEHADLDAAQAAAMPDRFTVAPKPIGAGFTPAAYWLAFQVRAVEGGPGQWLLEVGMPYLDFVDLYLPDGRGGFLVQHLGDRLAFAERPIAHRNFIFTLDVPAGETRLVLLRVKTSSAMVVRATLWTPAAFAAAVASEDFFVGLLYGAVTLVAVFALYLWLTLREPVYRWFLFHVVVMTFHNLTVTGYGSQLLFPHLPVVADGAVGFSLAMSLATGCMLTIHMLDMRRHSRRLSALFTGGAIVAALLSVSVFFGRWATVGPLANLLAFAITAFTLVLSLRWSFQKNLMAPFVALSLAPAGLGACMLIGRNLGFFSIAAGVLDWSTQVGHIAYILILAYGLTQRMRVSELERRRLRAALLEQLRSEKKRLTALVEQRTAEVVAGRKAVEAALETERRAALDQRTFLSMVAHEFRRPLQQISAAASVMGFHIAPDNREGREEMGTIRHGVGHLSQLVNSFLADGWVEAAALIPHLEPMDLSELLAERSAAWLGKEKGRSIAVAANQPATVLGDASLLGTALSNLVENALKYSAPGTPVTLALTVEGEAALVSVTDCGIGIAPDDLPRIFDRYYRSDRSRATAGIGLGLHIVQRVVQAHGGEVNVSSEQGRGSTFQIRLPLHRN